MKRFLIIVVSSFCIYFFAWIIVYKTNVNALPIQSEDTLPAMFLPVTILKSHTLYVDNYYSMLINKYPHPDDKSQKKDLTPFYLRKIRNHYISAFPIITGLLALPIYIVPVLLGLKITFSNLIVLSHMSSSLIVSLSGGFFYLFLKKHFLENDKDALILTTIYLFGTINFALLSQSLWQHGTLELFTILGLYFFFNYLNFNYQKLHNLFISSVFFGTAILSRPTAILYYLIFYLLIFVLEWKNVYKLIKHYIVFLAGLFPASIFFFWYNNNFYETVSNQGYASQITSEWLSKFPEGFLGVWFSPSKGLLIYSPVFIFSILGVYIAFKTYKERASKYYITMALIVLLHTLIIGKWKHWYGGWSFGYRMSSDVIPFLVLLIVPYIKGNLFLKTKKLFYSLILLSVFIEFFGMVFFDGVWHAAYDRGFKNTSWLWSLKDSEFIFNFRRVMVKLGLLTKACSNCN